MERISTGIAPKIRKRRARKNTIEKLVIAGGIPR
jgi:hypothetical protein